MEQGYQGLCGGEGNAKLVFNGYRFSVVDEEKVLGGAEGIVQG